MIAPIINLNGTDGATLEREHQIVVEKFNELVNAMEHGMPHPRDFQLNKPGEYESARKQHIYRIERLREIRDEMTLIYAAISDQNDAKRKA